MPRSYGRIATSIWRDPDFRDRTPDAKLVYLMLVTQAEINPAGLLDVTSKRWRTQLGLTTEDLDDALAELEKHRFVIVDEATEELLVRSFVKWDGGASNDLRRRAIRDSAWSVQSPRIVNVLAAELDRQGVPHDLSERVSDTPTDRATHALSDRASIEPRYPLEHQEQPEDTGQNRLSDRASDTRRVVVTKAGTEPQPGSATPNQSRGPEPYPQDPPLEFCDDHPTGTDRNCAACGRRRIAYETWQRDDATARAKDRDRRIRAAQDAAINADLQRGHDPDAFRRAKAEAEATLAARRLEQPPAVEAGDDLTAALDAAITRQQTRNGADA